MMILLSMHASLHLFMARMLLFSLLMSFFVMFSLLLLIMTFGGRLLEVGLLLLVSLRFVIGSVLLVLDCFMVFRVGLAACLAD